MRSSIRSIREESSLPTETPNHPSSDRSPCSRLRRIFGRRRTGRCGLPAPDELRRETGCTEWSTCACGHAIRSPFAAGSFRCLTSTRISTRIVSSSQSRGRATVRRSYGAKSPGRSSRTRCRRISTTHPGRELTNGPPFATTFTGKLPGLPFRVRAATGSTLSEHLPALTGTLGPCRTAAIESV